MAEMRNALARDGTPLSYALVGGGKARVALVHSLALDHRFWMPVAERLSEIASVLLVDCRGHGRSGGARGPFTAELMADDLADVLDAVGWPSAVVGGASMGGCVSLAFAGRHPERLEGLALFDTTAWYGSNARQEWEERAAKARANGLASLVPFQKTRWFGDDFRCENPEIVERFISIFLDNDVETYCESCRMLGNADLRDVLSGISVPACILVGEEDYATPPEMARDLHAAIDGSSLTELKGGRHLTPLEFPDVIADEIRTLAEEAGR